MPPKSATNPKGTPSVTHHPWPCTTCEAPGVRNLGTEGFCAHHLTQLYTRFDPAVFALHGIGLPGHTSSPHDLTCVACQATWTGTPGEPCPWCQRRHHHQLDHQTDLLLEPPDPLTATTLTAWARRLATAVQAGLIDEHTARRTLQRAERHAA